MKILAVLQNQWLRDPASMADEILKTIGNGDGQAIQQAR